MKLPNDIASCHAIILLLQKEVALLTQKVVALEERLNKNSRNSNKPPSTDGLSKPPKIQAAFPKQKGKKSGGQPKHKGKTLGMVQNADQQIVLLASHCSCGQALDDSTLNLTVLEKRQVFDIPEPKLEVTEFQKMGGNCSNCGTYHKGTFPQRVKARVQYGTRIKTLAVLLNTHFKVPLKKISTLFSDLYGYAVNQSTIVKATKKCSVALKDRQETIKQALLKSQVVHCDESGVRVSGKLHWLHTVSNKHFTYLFVHPKRGKEALLDEVSLLPQLTKNQWAVHDCWMSYFSFDNCKHALCGAHLLRELTALVEQNSSWASLFKDYLLALYQLTNKGLGALQTKQKQSALYLYEQLCKYANEEEPPPQKSSSGRGKPKSTKGRNLLKRLVKHQSAVLAFAFHEEVPFTNNQAERDLRPIKTKLKVAGCFRTLSGAQIYACIQAFISTIRKQQRSVFSELQFALEAKPFALHQSNPPK